VKRSVAGCARIGPAAGSRRLNGTRFAACGGGSGEPRCSRVLRTTLIHGGRAAARPATTTSLARAKACARTDGRVFHTTAQRLRLLVGRRWSVAARLGTAGGRPRDARGSVCAGAGACVSRETVRVGRDRGRRPRGSRRRAWCAVGTRGCPHGWRCRSTGRGTAWLGRAAMAGVSRDTARRTSWSRTVRQHGGRGCCAVDQARDAGAVGPAGAARDGRGPASGGWGWPGCFT
jgi:hypothetical protein